MVVVALWTEGKFGRWVLRDEWGVVVWHGVINGNGPGVWIGRWGIVVGFWCIEVEPALSILVGLEVGVAGFVVIGHSVVGLAMEGAVGLVAEVGVFQRLGTGLSAMGSGARGEDCVVALADETLIKEGSE
jgi:hypothetical protein